MKPSAHRLLIGIFVSLLAMAVFSAVPVFANTITVTSLADSGPGSLRDAIAGASSGDTINFGVMGPITLTSGELLIGKNLTISGPGASSVAISANNLSRVFEIGSGFTVAISGLTIQNGKTDNGGGIYNGGTLMLSNSTLSSNSASSNGGGIANYGTLTVTNSTLSGNSSVAGGGGFVNSGGTLTVTNSTLSGNSVTGSGFVTGGGIFIYGGTVTVTNSTLSGNSAWAGGGIYTLYATVTLANNTISGNSAPYGGGGIFVYNGTATAKNTILANGLSGGNCYQPLTSQGHNLSDDTTCSGYFNQTGDLNNTPAGLDPSGLKNNGGSAQTIALLATSPAVNAIPLNPTNYCTDVNGAPVNTDQRGFARPAGPACDIGAFELGGDDDTGLAQLNGSNNFNGNQTVNGNVNATNFVGNGTGLTGVNASLLGGLPAGNYARLDIGNLFSGNQNVSGNVTANAFVGDGSALTHIVAATASTANFALSAGDAMTLGHVAAGNYARLDIGDNFNGNQTITGGNLALDNTNGAGTTGVITLGGNPFLNNFGAYNTFVGQNAGNFNASNNGSGNTASGYQALFSNTTGANNTATGGWALNANTTGYNNTASGLTALYLNTGGYNNTASGYQALRANTNGSFNTAFGYALIYNNTGSNNTAVGFQAGVNENGANANTTGSNNTFLGYSSGPQTPTQLTNATAIGSNAVVNASNALVLGSINGVNGAASSVNVGIGTAMPGYALDVQGGQINASGGLCIAGTCQTSWPSGGGTITGVTAGSGLFGGGTTGNVSLSIPAAGVSNAMLANPSLAVNAGAGLTGGGSVSLGGSTTVALATNTCATGSAVTAHPFTCTAFPTFGANTFTGNQTMPTLTVTGPGGINSTLGNFSGNNGTAVIFAQNGLAGTGWGVYGIGNGGVIGIGTNYGVHGETSGGGPAVVGAGTGNGNAGVYGFSINSGIGVLGSSPSGPGIRGDTSSLSAAAAAGLFNNYAAGNAGNILLGQSAGVTKFSVDGKGDVAASGNVTAGGSVTIGTGGTPILEHLSGKFAVSVAAGIGPGGCLTLPTITFAGASDGDTIALGVPNALVAGTAGDFLEYFAWVSAANTVTIRVCNLKGNTGNNLAAGTIRVDIWKH